MKKGFITNYNRLTKHGH